MSGSPSMQSTIAPASSRRQGRRRMTRSASGISVIGHTIWRVRAAGRVPFPIDGIEEGDDPMTTMDVRGRADLSVHGLNPAGRIVWSPTTAVLYEHAVKRGDGRIAEGGPLVVDTGKHTGRSPKDKFIVREPSSEDRIWWEGNNELGEENFEKLRDKVDAFAGADPAHRIAVRVVTDRPYHALFAKTLFIDPTEAELKDFRPDALVLHAPEVEADPATEGTRTGTFVVLHPARAELVVGGTFYAGEIKKSIFTVLNDRLPLEGVLPMHCSANVSQDGHNV